MTPAVTRQKIPGSFYSPSRICSVSALILSYSALTLAGNAAPLVPAASAQTQKPNTQPSHSADFIAGQKYEASGDYGLAVVLYTRAGDSGDSEAYLRIAKLYEAGKVGLGRPDTTYRASLPWYQKAAQSGNSEAISYLNQHGEVTPVRTLSPRAPESVNSAKAASTATAVPVSSFPRPGNALIYVYHNSRFEPPAGTTIANGIYVNKSYLPALPRGYYVTYEIPAAPSGTTTVAFTSQAYVRPLLCYRCIPDGGTRYGAPVLYTYNLLQIRVQQGKAYYVSYGASIAGMKLVKEDAGKKEITGMTSSASVTLLPP